MKTHKLFGLLFLASCGNKPNESVMAFERLLPDTSKTWSGQMTRQTFEEVKNFEIKFHLSKLSEGAATQEIRIWNLSGSFDPQVLSILQHSGENQWKLRTLSFYHTKGDSVYADNTKTLRQSLVDSLDINRLWEIPSQSDMKTGDKYGCLDGGDIFIEMANTKKYRFLWYNCPDINKEKHTAFNYANDLAKKMNGLAAKD
jgi:hypothetical protein